MSRNVPVKAEPYALKNKLRRIWRQFVRVMACIVVFCTTYAMILPAITMQRDTICGISEHTHGMLCYVQLTSKTVQELTCTYESLGVHVHTAECLDEMGEPVCGYADWLVHTHDDRCGDTCTLPEISEHTHSEACYNTHAHDEVCYTAVPGALLCELHVHGDGCYDPGEPVCGVTEEDHVHGDACYTPTLLCGEGDHTHGDGCYEEALVLSCGLEEVTAEDAALICGKEEVILHSHGDDCYDAETGELACGMTEVEAHSHTGPCFTSQEIPLDDMETLTCTVTDANHLHIERCYGTWAMICGTEEHTHVESCYPAEQASEYDCSLTEHAHDDGCYDAEGALRCTLEPHSHAESGCELAAEQETEQETEQDADPDVAYVDSLIGRIPSADEIEAKLAEFQAAGDAAGEEAWLEEVYQDVAEAYHHYAQLSDIQKAALADEQKLLDLEYIWSVTSYAEDWTYTWKAPTLITDAAHTSDFIQLNVYDYTWQINNKFWANQNIEWKTVNSNGKTTATGVTSKYPGFQWNGGAYMQSGTFNRYKVDFIDFGNSVVRDGYYKGTDTGVTDGKSNQAVAVAVNRNALNTDSGDTVKIINNINTIDVSSYGVTNRPVGMGLNGSAYGYGNDVLTRISTSLGYPALSNEVGGGSLQYLFGGEDVDYVIKQNKDGVSIDGLFQIDPVSGAYYYNSRENHAQLHDSDGDGYYDKFLLFKEFLTPNFIVYPFGNFLPFNTINNSNDTTYIKGHSHLKGYIGGQMIASLNNATDSTGVQLKNMLGRYRQSFVDSGQWDTITPLEAIQDYFWGGASGSDNPSNHTKPIIDVYNAGKIYNIDYDVATNFFFGMDMSMNFMQPKNGMTGKDNGDNDNPLTNNAEGDLVRAGSPDGIPDYPMVFYFTGDDDVWVYIDGILFLDLSGIHRHVGGEIDFEKGEVRYYSLDTVVTGDVTGEPYQTYSFYDIVLQAYYYKYRNDGLSDDELYAKVNALVNPVTGRFRDYTTHNFHFFYTERGSGSSVCRMNFNFPMLRKNSITVTKKNVPDRDVSVLGNPDYYFSIIPEYNAEKPMVGPDSVTGISGYTILDSDGAAVGTGTVDEYGIFTLKAGQTAIFEGISENVGVFHVQELIPEADDNQYMKDVTINGAEYRNGNLIKWKDRPWYTGDSGEDGTLGPYNTRWYAYSSQKTDASSNSSFYFETQNGVKTANLGQLSITKTLDVEKPGTAANQVFKMIVKLDGIPLPVGTAYTVDGARKTVAAAGVIELKGGQTATISNILSGSRFEVSEDMSSARGFFVSYKRTDGVEAAVSGNTISGVVRHSATAALTVTNTDNAAGVTLDGVKSIANAGTAQGENTFSFVLTEVDENGNALADGYTDMKTVTVTNGVDTGFRFDLHYRAADYADGTVFPVTHRYRIQESGGDGFVSDGRCYIAWITVNKGTDGKLTAELTRLALNGEDADSMAFVNTLLGDLTLEKIVDGGALSRENDDFDFEIQFGTDDEPLANWTVQAVKNGESAGTLTTDSSGYITLTGIKHGDKVELKGIPLGTVWRITESGADGYIVDWTVNGTPGSSNVAEGGIPPGGAEVVYTNHSTYALPETGGPGTNSYAMVGLMLMLCSAAFLLYRFKKRGREVT